MTVILSFLIKQHLLIQSTMVLGLLPCTAFNGSLNREPNTRRKAAFLGSERGEKKSESWNADSFCRMKVSKVSLPIGLKLMSAVEGLLY